MRSPVAGILLFYLAAFAVDGPPTEWIDSATGHRIVRLTQEPGTENLYLRPNAFTAGSDKMLFTRPSGGRLVVDRVVFGSNMFGPSYVFAVQISKAR